MLWNLYLSEMIEDFQPSSSYICFTLKGEHTLYFLTREILTLEEFDLKYFSATIYNI